MTEEERRRQCIIDPALCVQNQGAAAAVASGEPSKAQIAALTTEMVTSMGSEEAGALYSVRDLARAAAHLLKTFRFSTR